MPFIIFEDESANFVFFFFCYSSTNPMNDEEGLYLLNVGLQGSVTNSSVVNDSVGVEIRAGFRNSQGGCW